MAAIGAFEPMTGAAESAEVAPLRPLTSAILIGSRGERTPRSYMPATIVVRHYPATQPARCSHRRGKRLADLGEHGVPIARCRLAEEAQARVPRTIRTIEQRAPLRRKRQHHTAGPPRGACQVHDRGVDGDHPVEIGDDRRGLGEIGQMRHQIDNPRGGETPEIGAFSPT
jgi:hypothetical protein